VSGQLYVTAGVYGARADIIGDMTQKMVAIIRDE